MEGRVDEGMALARLHGARDRVPLDADRDHRPLRVQQLERAELADPGALDEVVLAGDPRPGDAGGARAVARRRRGLATAVALVLGLTAGLALDRLHFFGKEIVSFIFVLPIALPGIITGMALNSFFVFWKVQFGLWTIVIGHATFCVVVVYNNVLARLRRTPGSLKEASMDLGAGPWTTWWRVTLPTISTALISGALLAFALSFDEVIVTTFTAGAQNTLPLWIFGNIRLGQTLPETNVVVLLVLAATILPVVAAQRLTRESGILRTE